MNDEPNPLDMHRALPDPVEELRRACAMMVKGFRADRRGRPEVLTEQIRQINLLLLRMSILMPQIRAWDRQQAMKANERSWR